MKKQELAGFVLKLIGAYALIQSLPQLQSIVVIMGGLAREGHELPNAFWLYIGMMLPFVLMLLTGIVLIVYSRPFGRILFRKDNSSEIESGICSEEFQAIGFSIVAVLIVLQAIPRIGHFVVNLWQLMRNDIPHGMGDWFIRSTWQVGIITSIQLGLAFVLFLRAKGLANLWNKIQASRYKDAKQNSPDNQSTALPPSDI